MAKRLLLRDAENISQDMLQRILGMEVFPTVGVGGVGTGYAPGVIGKLTGSGATGHMAVTANGTTMVLTILPGWAAVLRDAGGSTYDPRALFAESDANDSTITITSNATGSTRNDTVCLKIDQNTAPTSDGSNLVSFVAIAGQSGGGLSNAPADGNLYLPLANVAVANGATSLSQGNVTDKRTSVITTASPILVPTGYAGGFGPTAFGSLPVKIDEQSPSGVNTFNLGGGTLPTAFRHLLIEIQSRSDRAAQPTDECGIRFNTDSGANYGHQRFADSGTTNTGQESGVTGQTSGRDWFTSAATALAGGCGVARIWIPNYNGSTFKKMARIDASHFIGTTFPSATQLENDFITVFWNNTNAITRIDLLTLNGNWLAGTLATLYGIP